MCRLKKWGIVLVVLYLLSATSAYIYQEHLVFFPSKLPTNNDYGFCQEYEDFFTNDDGAHLSTVHIKQYSAKGIILFFMVTQVIFPILFK